MADAVVGLRFAVFPFVRIHHLLDAGFHDGVEVVRHLHHYVLAVAAVFFVEIEYGMGGGAGAAKVI